VTRSRAADKWLRSRGADHVLFKICSTFDSTDAGNIGPVMGALRADSGEAIVLVTPAFPETGRTVYQGNLFVGAVPLNESPLKDHPLNPMRHSNLVRVLARQSTTQIGRVDLTTVTGGAAAVRARRAELSGPRSGCTLDGATPRRAGGPVLIASSSTPDQVAALQARHGRDAAGHAIEQAMADIAEGLVKAGVKRLIVAGGETSGAVVDRLKIPGFLVGVEIAAGVPVLRAVGAEAGDMLLALKSGNFGGAEFFSDALGLMR